MDAVELELIYDLKEVATIDFNTDKTSQIMNILDKVVSYLVRHNISNLPTNMSELFEFIYNRPLKDYINDINSDEPFILYNGEINTSIQEYIDEDNVEEKVQQETMRNLLKLCRQNDLLQDDKYDWADVYRTARSFICTHYLIEKRELDSILIKLFPLDISQFIKMMYEPEYEIKKQYLACPVCGKSLDNQMNDTIQCTNPVCNYYINKDNLTGIERVAETKLVKLHSGIYRYILSPSIGEIKIYDKLKKKFAQYDVCLYPNIDEYDISVASLLKTIYIDIKDVAKPMKLVQLLKEECCLDKLLMNREKNVLLVIPDHRVRIYREQYDKKYIPELKNILENEHIQIKVVQERQLASVIEEAMQ